MANPLTTRSLLSVLADASFLALIWYLGRADGQRSAMRDTIDLEERAREEGREDGLRHARDVKRRVSEALRDEIRPMAVTDLHLSYGVNATPQTLDFAKALAS